MNRTSAFGADSGMETLSGSDVDCVGFTVAENVGGVVEAETVGAFKTTKVASIITTTRDIAIIFPIFISASYASKATKKRSS
jgi:hypothetical protein